MDRDSFVFYKEWMDAIIGLPGEVRLEIYEAIIEYGTSGKLSDLKPMARLAFNFAKAKIDKDVEKYHSMCEKRAHAAKSAHAAKVANAANAANATFACKSSKSMQMQQLQQLHANATDNDCDNDLNDNDCDNDLNLKKKPTNVGQKEDAAVAAARFEERKEGFYNSLIPFVTTYGKEMVRSFFEYWTEPNKSHTKMRFELERTWDVSRRLRTWASRDKTFNRSSNGTDSRTDSTPQARAAGAASIVARLLAEDNVGQ